MRDGSRQDGACDGARFPAAERKPDKVGNIECIRGGHNGLNQLGIRMHFRLPTGNKFDRNPHRFVIAAWRQRGKIATYSKQEWPSSSAKSRV
jgi:hypothetical protein